MAENTQDDEYELLPQREIEELKEELAKLKEFEIAPSKRLQVSLLELNTKLDRLLTIFEDATHELRLEEGGISFTEKMKPMLEKMGKILEQNSEIASGILALADMVKEGKSSTDKEEVLLQRMETDEMQAPAQQMPPLPPRFMPPLPPPPLPMTARTTPEILSGPPLPPMQRRRTFGL